MTSKKADFVPAIADRDPVTIIIPADLAEKNVTMREVQEIIARRAKIARIRQEMQDDPHREIIEAIATASRRQEMIDELCSIEVKQLSAVEGRTSR